MKPTQTYDGIEPNALRTSLRTMHDRVSVLEKFRTLSLWEQLFGVVTGAVLGAYVYKVFPMLSIYFWAGAALRLVLGWFNEGREKEANQELLKQIKKVLEKEVSP